jgi:hypothetical protein
MKGPKKHLNNQIMSKVRFIYLELLGFSDTKQSPFLVESFIVFFFFVVLMISSCDLFIEFILLPMVFVAHYVY